MTPWFNDISLTNGAVSIVECGARICCVVHERWGWAPDNPALSETEDVGGFDTRQDTILETMPCDTLTETRISNSDITGFAGNVEVKRAPQRSGSLLRVTSIVLLYPIEHPCRHP